MKTEKLKKYRLNLKTSFEMSQKICLFKMGGVMKYIPLGKVQLRRSVPRLHLSIPVHRVELCLEKNNTSIGKVRDGKS